MWELLSISKTSKSAKRIPQVHMSFTKEGIIEFSTQWDPLDFHTDEEEAESSMFEGLAASGVHTACIANRLGHDTPASAVRAALSAEYRWPNPARVGDELMLSRTIIDTRESKSRPDVGIVQHISRLVNQEGSVVIEIKVALLVAKRPQIID